MSGETPESERVYAIHIAKPAATDVEEAANYLRSLAGEALADEWENGFYAAIRTLSRMPRKHRLAERESRYFGLSVRTLLYERGRGGAAYRVFFTVVDDDADPPFVRILHVRHGMRRPITRAEARERLSVIEDAG